MGGDDPSSSEDDYDDEPEGFASHKRPAQQEAEAEVTITKLKPNTMSPKQIRAEREAKSKKEAKTLRQEIADVDVELPMTENWWFEEMRKRQDVHNMIDHESCQRLFVGYRDKVVHFSGDISAPGMPPCILILSMHAVYIIDRDPDKGAHDSLIRRIKLKEISKMMLNTGSGDDIELLNAGKPLKIWVRQPRHATPTCAAPSHTPRAEIRASLRPGSS